MQYDRPIYVMVNPVSGVKKGVEIWHHCERLLKAAQVPYEVKGRLILTVYYIVPLFC